jgi:hypothetical protein
MRRSDTLKSATQPLNLPTQRIEGGLGVSKLKTG